MRTKTFLLALLVLSLSMAACSPSGGEIDAEPTAPPKETPVEQPTEVPAETTVPDELLGTWFWQAYEDTAGLNDIFVSDSSNYTLEFTVEGIYHIQADCNSGGGSYTVDADSISLEPGPMTMAECGPDSLYNDFLVQLGAVASFVLDEDGRLVLSLKDDAGDMILVSTIEKASDLEGTSWVVGSILADDVVSVTEIDQEITAVFQDGQLTGFAGCNNYFTSYETDGTTLTLGLTGSTMMACDDARTQRETEFLTALEAVIGYHIAGDNLELLDAAGNVVILLQTPGETTVPSELLGTWYWLAYQDMAELNDIIVSDPSKYTLEFLADGTVQIQADCNSASSNVTIDGSSLTFAPGPMTLAECEPGSLYSEYLAKLGDVVTFVFDEDGTLLLNLKMDAGNMVFGREATPPFPSELVGQVWYWLAFEDSADGAESNDITVSDPMKYTLEFLPDGTYTVEADCNRSGGGYNAEGSSLALLPGPTTLAECEPGSLYNDYLVKLDDVVTYVFDEDGKLYLNLKVDAGNMVFGPDAHDNVDEYTYTFEGGTEGWEHGFADLPTDADSDFYQLHGEWSQLPGDLEGFGYRLQGNNHSDDLFMFIKARVDGLKPGTIYNVAFAIDLATAVPEGMVGIGGSPGESVYLKVGAMTDEPAVFEDDSGWLRMSIDKGQQSEGGAGMVVLGHIAYSADASSDGGEWQIKRLDNGEQSFQVTAGEDSALWFIAGTDSGFEGLTDIYFDAVTITLTPAG